MPTVQKRSTSTKTANRRRDRAREEEEATAADDDDVDVDDNEDEDDVETEDEEEDEKAEGRVRPARRTGSLRSRERRQAEDENGDEEAARPARRRSSTKTKAKAPSGVRHGWEGADETLKAGGVSDWFTPDKNIQLIKFLQDEPLVSCRQHWVEVEGNSPGQTMRRPYVCPGKDCPLCELGDNPGPLYAFNVLLISGSEEPKNKLLRLTTTGYQNLREVSADRKTGDPVIDKDFFAVQKTGAGTNSARVVFRPVKERDLSEDWDEIFDQFDPEDLGDIIAEAQDNLFPDDVVKPTPRRELEKLARYLNDQED